MSSSQKRPCPFSGDIPGRMVRQRHIRQETDLASLSAEDYQALERTASLFDIPISELLTRTSNDTAIPSTKDLQFDSQVGSSSQTLPSQNGSSSSDSNQARSTLPEEPFYILPHSASSSLGFPYGDLGFNGPFSMDAQTPCGQGDLLDTSNFRVPFPTQPSLQQTPTMQTALNSWEIGNRTPTFHTDHSGIGYSQSANDVEITTKGMQSTFQPSNAVGILQSPNEGFSNSSDHPLTTESEVNGHLRSAEDVEVSQVLFGTSVDSSSSGWSLIEPPQEENGLSETIPTSPSNHSFQWVPCNPRQAQSQSGRRSRGPFQDRQLREQTGNVRKLKACVRCRMQKIRCQTNDDDPSGVCRTCQGISTMKIYTLPCLRYKITEATLYRVGKGPGLEFTRRWPVMKLKDISKWASTQVRTIYVKSDVCPEPLELSVRKFVPIPEDRLHKGWMDGKVKKFKETTPYAIVNMISSVETMRTYIHAHTFKCMDFFLRGTDDLIVKTYSFARRYMVQTPFEDEKLLLQNFFQLWFAIRRTATVEHIVGEDTIDMAPETVDRSYPLFGKVPLPPVLIQQLDMILTLGVLNPLRKKVLEGFQKLVLANKPRSWLTIYLVTFMLLHSVAVITAENYKNARQHGLRRRYSIPTMISELHHGANVFLGHYHYATAPCNPFGLDWKRRHTTPFAHLAPDEIHFLIETKNMVKEREDIFKTTKDITLYEDDMYFVAQMFEDSWTPRDTVIDYDDGTVNDVPLSKFYGDGNGKT
ncbi:hypothetical protein FQN53_004457 [Emmonsiellopsis sp. PD_33]|nr:hypothetical protein FQN53_004457 [Emmonsiellopsis sp. PD_33]